MADAQASGACGRKIVWVQVPSPALFFALRIKNWFGGPIRITLPGMMQKLPGRVFLFLCGEDVQTGKENRRISDSVKLFKIIAIIHIFHKIKKIKNFSKKVLTFL